jgi:hypothetical protein
LLIADAQQGIQTEHVADCNMNRLANLNSAKIRLQDRYSTLG